MNLFVKVTLTLLLAVTVALATAGILAARGARQATQAYVGATLQEQGVAVAIQAATTIAQSASWEQAQASVDNTTMAEVMGNGGMGGMMSRGLMGGMMGNGQMRGQALHMGRMHSWTLVALDSDTPLATTGLSLTADALALSVPVIVGGAPVARLAPNLLPSGLTPAEELFLQQMQQALWISALVAGIVAVAAGSALAASILRPLRRVEQTVETIARGDLAARVDPVGADEIGRLATGVNAMAAGLQRQEELRQRMVSDIAHELRTPLTVMQGNLQAILDGVYPLNAGEIRLLFDESRLLGRLVEDLHELAQAEAHRLPLALEAVDVAATLANTLEGFRPLAAAQGVALDVSSVPGLFVRADPGRLHQVLHNLLSNALRHTSSGGTIQLKASAAGECVRIKVTDSGSGIAPADLPYIFDRFYRVEMDRARGESDAQSRATGATGAGLGLAIVKALVEAHGGRVGAQSLRGHGTTVWFELQVAP